MEKYGIWVERLQAFKLPRFESLPEIPLYLDQVLEYVNPILADLFDGEEVVTRSMINNYVKHKIMPAPVKKRYTNEHVAYVIVISVFKPVLSLPNIAKGFEIILSELDAKQGYNVFTEYVEGAIQEIMEPILQRDAHIPLKIASKTFAGKILLEYYFKTMKEGGE